MKSLIILSLLFVITFNSCKKDELQKDIPICINEMIENLKNEPVRNPPSSVWQYEYKGKTVYFVPMYCCDFFSELYDNDCNIICYPDGGIHGGGDGNCADFFVLRKKEKLIWQDEREWTNN